MSSLFLRRLLNRRNFSLLNLLGLAVGLAAALLIFLVIRYESGFDRYHRNFGRIVRPVITLQMPGEKADYNGCVPLPFAAAIQSALPQLETVARVWEVGKTQFSVPNSTGGTSFFKEPAGTYYAEPALFQIFDFSWLSGNVSALTAPDKVVLTESMAGKWFGHWQNAMGKTIWLGDSKKPFLVSAVLKDPPPNTDLPFHIVLPYIAFLNNQSEDRKQSWGFFNSRSECFALLKPNASLAGASAGLKAFSAAHFNEANGFDRLKTTLALQPLADMHFDSRFEIYGKRDLTEKESWALALIAVFLVVIACVNFVNISTAQSFTRSKEIGVRKVLGSSRSQLIGRSLKETAGISVLALLLAAGLAWLCLPALNRLLDKSITLSFTDPLLILFLLGALLFVILLAGLYPGLVIARFAPINAIRNNSSLPKSGSHLLRRFLVVLQFGIAQLLLIGTFVVLKQINYIRTKDTGFDSHAVAMVDIPNNDNSRARLNDLRARVARVPGVVSASLCSDPPSKNGSWDISFRYDTHPDFASFNVISRYADTSYLKTFNLRLLAGRYPVQSDTMREVVLNAATTRALGLKSPEEALNKMVDFGSGMRYPVVGILADFNNKTLRDPILPMMLSTSNTDYQKLAVKLNPHEIPETMAKVQAVFASVFPEHAFDTEFFDEAVANFYQAEEESAVLFRIFAGIAIFLSCLGLYGLVSLIIQQKTREVGIRKVLGASVSSIVYLFSREFALLIGISFAIAAPLGIYFMSRWLEGFFYRTAIGWVLFVLTFGLALAVAGVSIGFKTMRAAMASPVKSLKQE